MVSAPGDRDLTTHYDCVIFDLDGTVLDSHTYTFDAFRHAVSPWGVTLEDADIHAAFGPPERVILQGFVPTEHVDAAYGRLQAWYVEHAARARPHQQILDVLQALHDAGVVCCLFTGRAADSTAMLLQAHDLTRFFRAVVAGDAALRPKPAPDGITWLLQEVGCAASRCLVVGDSILDVQAATAAGAASVGAAWFTPPEVSRITSDVLQEPRDVLSRIGLLQGD